MGTLALVRHGESLYNLENRFTGWADPPITERGRTEMHQAAEGLRGIAFAGAFCSALRRSRDSARIVLDALGQPDVPLESSAALNERDYGELQGLAKDEAVARFGAERVRLWRRSFDAVPPGGESVARASERVLGFFHRRIVPEARRTDVLVCAHGNTLRAIVRELEALDEEAFRAYEIPTGSALVYRVDADGRAEIVARHLPENPSPGGSIL